MMTKTDKLICVVAVALGWLVGASTMDWWAGTKASGLCTLIGLALTTTLQAQPDDEDA